MLLSCDFPLIALETDTYLEDDAAHLSPPGRVQPLCTSGPSLCAQERCIPVVRMVQVVCIEVVVEFVQDTVFRREWLRAGTQVTELNILVDDERVPGWQWWRSVLG